jgi:hypothetical protein
MAARVNRKTFDFLATDYKTVFRRVKILAADSSASGLQAQPEHKANFVQRWYLSLQGDDRPITSEAILSKKTNQRIYRYDWAFGMTVIKGFWWDWVEDLCKDSALAVHLLMESIGDAPEMVPVSATLSALHPSKNTKTIWETSWPKIPKAAADMAKVSSLAVPPYLSSGLMLTSNILDSYTETNQKNWFLYQFFDERLKCPTVEWRINRQVLKEYGPLLRGTLFAAFYGSPDSHPGCIRVQLRPQARYYEKGDLDFIIPTDEFEKEQQVQIEIKPQDEIRPPADRKVAASPRRRTSR